MDRTTHRAVRGRNHTLVLVSAIAACAAVAIAGISAAAPGATGWSTGLTVRCAPGYDHARVARDGTISCSPTTVSTPSPTARDASDASGPGDVPPNLAAPVPTLCAPMATAARGDRTAKWDAPITTPVDATGARWHSDEVGDYAVSLLGDGPGACWKGGTIVGDWGPDASWSHYHDTAALRFSQPGTTIADVRIDGYGDAVKPKDDDGGRATNWIVRGVHVEHAYDDCVENDYLHGGVLADSLLDCYVGYSARASDGQGTRPDGTVILTDDLIRLEPQPEVYKGPAPGTGGWFKLGDTSPPMMLDGVVLAAGLTPNHQDLTPPATMTVCRDVTILWTGDGSGPRAPAAFPETEAWRAACPGVRIVDGPQAAAEWNLRSMVWIATHPVG